MPDVELFNLESTTPSTGGVHGGALLRGEAGASAELRRGVDMSAHIAVHGSVSGKLGEQVTASLEGAVNAEVEGALQAFIPLDLFTEAGIVGRFRLQAAASASLAVTLGLGLSELRWVVDDVVPDTLAPLLGFFFDELEIGAGIWGTVDFAAEVVAEAALVGSLLPGANGSGFTFTARYGAGLGFGTGVDFVANLGLRDPARMIGRTGDYLSGLTLELAEEALATLPAADRAAAQPPLELLRILLPGSLGTVLETGLALAGTDTTAPGQVRQIIVDRFVTAARSVLLDGTVRAALSGIGSSLANASLEAVAAALDDSQQRALVDGLLTVHDAATALDDAEESGPGAAIETLLSVLDALVGVVDLQLLPAAVTSVVEDCAAKLWCAGALAQRVADAAAAGISPAGVFTAGMALIPASRAVADHVAADLGRPAGQPLTLIDLVAYLLGGDPVAEIRDAAPEAAVLLDWLTEPLGVAPAELTRYLLTDGSVGDPETVVDGLANLFARLLRDEITPKVLNPLRASIAGDPGLTVLFDELVVPTVVALPVVLLPNLVLATDSEGRRRFREALSAVILQVTGRFLIATSDALLHHGLAAGRGALGDLADLIDQMTEDSPTLALLMTLPLRAYAPFAPNPKDIASLLRLAATLAAVVDDHVRPGVVETMQLVLELGLGDDVRRAVAMVAVTGSEDAPDPKHLETLTGQLQDAGWRAMTEIGSRLPELALMHYVHEAELTARAIGEGAAAIVSAAKEAIKWLAQEVTRLRAELDRLGRQAAELTASIAADLAALADHLRGLADGVVDKIRAYGRSLVTPHIAGWPQWAKDTIYGLYDALFDAAAWVVDLPLTLLAEVAEWVHASLTGRLSTATSDEALIRQEVRSRIAGSTAGDVSFDLAIWAFGEKIFDAGRVTIPASVMLGAVTSAVLGDTLFTNTVHFCAARSVDLQATVAQQQTTQQVVDGQLDSAAAKVSAAELVPARPLAVKFSGVAPLGVHPAPARLTISVTGANATFVSPVLGVPRRVTLRINNAEYEAGPGLWNDTGSALELAVTFGDPGVPPSPTVTRPTRPQVITISPGITAVAKTATQVEFIEPFAGGGDRPRRLGALPLGERPTLQRFVKSRLADAKRAAGGRAAPGPVAIDTLARGAFTVDLHVVAPALVIPARPAPSPTKIHRLPVGPDGHPTVPAIRGLNIVQVSVADGEHLQASAAVAFFVGGTAPLPGVVISHIELAPSGPDWQQQRVGIRNETGDELDLTGWKLRDLAGHVYTFPKLLLPARGTVDVWTGPGAADARNLHWGRRAAVWNNDGDMVVLHDATGEERARRIYHGASGGQ